MRLLARRAVATPDRTALVDAADGRGWRYRDLDALVDRAVDRLRERAPETDRVGTLFAPSPASVVTLHAAWRLGWTVVGLDTRLTGAELEARIDRAEVDLLVHGAVEPPGSVGVPTLSGAAFADAGVSAGDTGRRPPARDGPAPGPRVGPDDPGETAVILFTSGTSAAPKGVRLTAGNLHASAVASAFRLGVSPDDRWLCCLPVHHMGGLAPVLRTALYGTTLVVQRSFDAGETASALATHDVTGVSLVPTQLRRLLDADAPLADLETVLVGGAPTPDPLLDRALAADVPVSPTYGLTEAASQVATARPAEAAAHRGTVGQPLYGVGVTVVADGEPVTPGEHGELVVSGPTVTPGYLDEATTEAASGEWGLHTGDVGYRDEAGRLWVLGRRDDLVLTGGELVAPDEVVETLCAHPAVADAAVVGLDDEEWGERVAALVVAETDLDTTALRAHCRGSLAGYKCPKTVAFADSIPRTVSGTVDREAVRDALRGHSE
jgi:O-succinylbenzoic acid--CoA ligase